jgi:hypothetical protein
MAGTNGGYARDMGQQEAAVCGRTATMIAPQRWILIAVATAFLVADGLKFM